MATNSPPDNDYVLGTSDRELERLGLQHRVWRPRVLDAWQRAGFTIGQTIVDVGSGPGYATRDLAEIVGPGGRVVAVERSVRFLGALNRTARDHNLANVTTHALDLDETAIPVENADAAWCRWVLCFVTRPREVLTNIVRTLRPGGVLVLHEYFDYRSWRVSPRSILVEEFVAAVMQSWRDHGGEPDIALQLPAWLNELGVEIVSLRPIVDVVPRSNYVWEWPSAFIETGLERLVSLNTLTSERADEIRNDFARVSAMKNALMVTPGLLEIVARRT